MFISHKWLIIHIFIYYNYLYNFINYSDGDEPANCAPIKGKNRNNNNVPIIRGNTNINPISNADFLLPGVSLLLSFKVESFTVVVVTATIFVVSTVVAICWLLFFSKAILSASILAASTAANLAASAAILVASAAILAASASFFL